MFNRNIVYTRFLFLSMLLLSSYINAEQPAEHSRPEIFPPKDGKFLPLNGKVLNGCYYAPKNVFSCQADDFGEGSYIAQDVLFERAACVGFYSPIGNFKRAEVMFMPELEKKDLGEKFLRDAFNGFGIGILKTVDNAQGIEILAEEMIEDAMFFSAISVEKMSVLKARNGKYMSSTRGYLVFRDKDKLVVLSNQIVTLPEQKHDPKKHMEKLKQEILEFKKTFDFGLIPPIPENSI